MFNGIHASEEACPILAEWEDADKKKQKPPAQKAQINKWPNSDASGVVISQVYMCVRLHSCLEHWIYNTKLRWKTANKIIR